MICLCPGNTCDEARLYYYDLLSGDQQETIPTQVMDHVKNCPQCQQQIVQLQQLLSEVDNDSIRRYSQKDDHIVRLLALHYGYLDQEVTCAVAKPFVPTLADESLKIRVITPITRHIEQCPECRRDIDTLRAQGLDSRQLFLVGQFLAELSSTQELPVVAAWADSVASLRNGELTAEQLKQISLSPRGRALILRARSQLLAELTESRHQDNIPCEAIENADLFEYAFPYGMEPAADENRHFKETLAAHIRQCRYCLDRLQHMHHTLFGIAERQDAEVVTVMRLSTEVEASELPPHVKTKEAPSRPQRSPRRITLPLVNAFAAVILLVIGLFFVIRISPVGAIEYRQMYDALKTVRGIRLTVQDMATQKQDLTAQKTKRVRVIDPVHGQFLLQREQENWFWDLPNAYRVHEVVLEGSIDKHTLDEFTVRKLQASMESFFGVLPEHGRVPAGSQWSRLEPDRPSDTVMRRELVIPKTLPDGQQELHKRIFYLDAKTCLPTRVEYWMQPVESEGFKLINITTLQYYTIDQLDRHLQKFRAFKAGATAATALPGTKG